MNMKVFAIVVIILQSAILFVKILKERSQKVEFRPFGKDD